MKHSEALLFTIFCVIFFTNCQNKSKTTNALEEEDDSIKSVLITGIVNHLEVYPQVKDIYIEIPLISGEFHKITTPFNKKGEFRFQFELNQPQNIRMNPYLDFLYVKPGDSIHVEIDFSDLFEVKLSGGKGIETNIEFLEYFNQCFYRESDFSIATDSILSCSMQKIREMLDDKKSLFYKRREAFIQNRQPNPEVIFLTEALIELDYYSTLSNIIQHRKFYGKEIIPLPVLTDEINRNTSKYFSKGIYTDTHCNFIENAYIHLRSINMQSDNDSTVLSKQLIDIPDNTIRNFILARQASIFLCQKEPDTFEKIYPHITDKHLRSRLRLEHKITLDKMRYPEAISASITGQKLESYQDSLSLKRNILSEMIAQHKGKVHYIDIWTTWCGPCIEEFSNFRSLINQYSNQDVEFSLICAGGTDQLSQEILKKYGLIDQPHRFCTQEDFSFLATTFSPICFPYGILVNKKGVIVDYGPHVKPSLIKDKIDILLRQDKLIN